MGILTRLFSKKVLETLEQVNQQIAGLLKKSDAKFVSLMGLRGKIKGLEIITVVDEKFPEDTQLIKRYNAKLVESYLRFQSLELMADDSGKKLQYTSYYYDEIHHFYAIPVENSDWFLITACTANIMKIIKNLDKITELLQQLAIEREFGEK
jgi:hypothetical protein